MAIFLDGTRSSLVAEDKAQLWLIWGICSKEDQVAVKDDNLNVFICVEHFDFPSGIFLQKLLLISLENTWKIHATSIEDMESITFLSQHCDSHDFFVRFEDANFLQMSRHTLRWSNNLRN